MSCGGGAPWGRAAWSSGRPDGPGCAGPPGGGGGWDISGSSVGVGRCGGSSLYHWVLTTPGPVHPLPAGETGPRQGCYVSAQGGDQVLPRDPGGLEPHRQDQGVVVPGQFRVGQSGVRGVGLVLERGVGE